VRRVCAALHAGVEADVASGGDAKIARRFRGTVTEVSIA
jgi:hypothetical protein